MAAGKRKSTFETPEGVKQWNANCAAAKAIKEGISNETIDINATPKQVWESNPLFQEYKLETFRQHYSKEKTKQGIHLRHDNKENNKEKGWYQCNSLHHFVQMLSNIFLSPGHQYPPLPMTSLTRVTTKTWNLNPVDPPEFARKLT
jgi:hypothetical protein